MPEEIILRVSRLEKQYQLVKAVDSISFSVRAGEIVGLLGPNGAGKTTTINMILGILEPSAGSVEILCRDLKADRCQVSRQTNFAAVYAHLPANLTVWQNLYIFGLLYGVKNLKKRVDILLKDFDLKSFSKTRVGLLSSGEASRLNLAKAVINQPLLLLLDEPTASLDPSIAQSIRQKIINYAAETRSAVLWTSHNMAEIVDVCNRVLFMSHGRILLSGDPKTLPAEHGKKDLEELFIAAAREPLSFDK